MKIYVYAYKDLKKYKNSYTISYMLPTINSVFFKNTKNRININNFLLNEVLFFKKMKKKHKIQRLDKFDQRLKNLTYTNRFVNILSRHGKKDKYINMLNKGLNHFYFYFYFLNSSVTTRGYQELFYTTPNFVRFFNFSTIVKHFVILLEPIFFIKVKKIEKKYKKLLKKKYQTHLTYIKPNKRANLAIRSIITYFNVFPSYRYYIRMGEAIFKSLVEHKQSYVYKKKINAYIKMFKKQKKKLF